MKEQHLRSYSRPWAGNPTGTRTVVAIMALFLIMGLSILPGCRDHSTTLYHPFPGHAWERFNILLFEMPVEHAGEYDIEFYARFLPGYAQEKLPFNMVLTTPAGEERIREFEMRVRSKTGQFVPECAGDSCEGSLVLKRNLLIPKPGILKIEIENLTPHIMTTEMLGVGIRLKRS